MKTKLLALLLVAPALAAAQQDGPSLRLSGYGTVGVAHSDNDRADYLVDAFKPNGPGYTHAWSADVDSRLGVQASASITSTVSAVVQVLAQQDYADTYRPNVEWANVRWQPTPESSIRAGRIVLPVFMVSDTRRVGYANPWVRPPVEFYAMVPVTYSDGLDASYAFTVKDAVNTVRGVAGRSTSHFPAAAGFGSGTAQARDLYEVVDTLEAGAFTARVSAGQARLDIPEYGQFADYFRAFGPEGMRIADHYLPLGKRVTYVGLGASYDPGKWFVMAEWGRFETRSILGTKVAWYASAGYRLGSLTPYVTFAQSRAGSNTSDPGIPLEGLPPPAAAAGGALNAALNQQLNLIPRQSTLSIGARWDFAKNAALKVQYDAVDLASGSTGTFGNIQPGFSPGGRVGIVSAVVDFVF